MAPTAGTRLRFKAAQAKKPFKKAKKLPSLKNRIRALERFLARGGVEADVRAIKREELDQLQRERDEKQHVEETKRIAEKSKKPRFFERVKLMRKLRQLQTLLDKTESKKDRRQVETDLEHCRHDLIYLYYFPKTEPYLALFPSKPLDEASTKRQQVLRRTAVARFEDEQPLDDFARFCTPDKRPAPSNAAVLAKKTPKTESNKKRKKSKTHDAKEAKPKQHVHADRDDDDSDGEPAHGGADDDEPEEDDFFL